MRLDYATSFPCQKNLPILHICILGFKCLEYWLNFPFHLPLEVKLGQFQKGQKASTKDPCQQWSLNQSRGHLPKSRVAAFTPEIWITTEGSVHTKNPYIWLLITQRRNTGRIVIVTCKITTLIGKIKLLIAEAISRWLNSFWNRSALANRNHIWCILRSSVTICAPLTVTDGYWCFFLNCTKASWSICKTLNGIKVLPIKNMFKHLIQYLISCFSQVPCWILNHDFYCVVCQASVTKTVITWVIFLALL